MGTGVEVIKRIAMEKLLFRERDVKKRNVSPSCLEDARIYGFVKAHGHGVWSRTGYEPTRYELVQIRLPNAVFCGPSALWLLGAASKEPDALWIAIGNKAKRPKRLPLGSVIIRSRNLEDDLQVLRPRGTVQELRVHSRERAQADVARSDLPGLLGRALRPRRFVLAPKGEFLFSGMTSAGHWVPPPGAPRGEVEPEARELWSLATSLP